MAFKSLVCAVSVQCQEIKQALASISYFDTWDSDVVAECCRVSSVAEYPPDTIILGPGTGTSHTAYFILEGVCKMIKNLQVEVKTNSRGRTVYKLHKPFESKTSHSKSMNEGYSSRLLNQELPVHAYKKDKISVDGEQSTRSKVDSDNEGEEQDETKCRTQTAEELLGEESKSSEIIEDKTLAVMGIQNGESQEEVPTTVELLPVEGIEEIKEKDLTEDPKSTFQTSEDIKLSPESEQKKEFLFEPDHHLKVLEESKKRGEKATGVCKKDTLPERPKNVECFFVQTGFLYKGACFGLEKYQNENFIMSTAKVKCLKIPRRFLFKHNPCYTWNRINLFHSLYLPKDEEILQRLRSDRIWIRDRQKQSTEIVSSTNIPNYTLLNEVPYSVRLAEVRLL